jgi:hypothetical protein
MKKVLLFISVVAVLSACKKEPLPDLPEDNTPFYLINGLMNGDSVSLSVGQEGITFAQGTTTNNGIESYFGLINSPSDNLEIRMDFTRPQKPMSASGLSVFDYSQLGYLVDNPGCVGFSFGSNQMQSNYLEIKDEQNNFESATQVDFEEFGKFDVDLRFSNFSQEVFTVPVNFGFEENQLNPDFYLIPQTDSVLFSPTQPDGNHQWFVDGSLASNESTHTDAYSIGIHTVEHKLRDEYGNVSTHFTLMRITDYVLDWKMDMNTCTPAPSNNYGKVIITIIKDGEEYSSRSTPVNLSNVFSASNLEFVSKQSGQEPTWAVFDFFFDAVLVNQTNTDSLSLDAMTGTFNIGL